MSNFTELEPLLRYCRDYRQRLVRLLAIVGGARLICLAVALFAAISLVDWWMHWNGWVRLTTLLGFLFAVGSLSVRIARSVRNAKLSDRAVLHQLGLRSPETSGQWLVWFELVTARGEIEELNSAAGQQMADSATQRLSTDVQSPAWDRVFDTTALRRWLTAAVATLVLLLVVASFALPQHVRIGALRLFVPFSTVRWPHRTTIDVVQPENGWTVPQLESFPIRATVTGEIPVRITLTYRTESNSTWVREKLPIRPDGTVQYTFPEVREPVQFTLSGGDYQTDEQQIDIVRRPFLKSITAHYEYPVYARLPDRTLSGGQLAGLEGTKVRLEMESSMPLTKAVMVVTSAGQTPASETIELVKRSDTRFTHELMLTSSGQYSVELFEPHGYREAKPEIYEIRVTSDDPPEVELLSPATDLVETNQASIEVSLKARDQLGLRQVAVFYQWGDGEPQALSDLVTGPIQQTGPESTARFTWELRKLELAESGTLRCFARARDNNPTGRGQRDSLRRQIKLVRPSEFHLEAIEQAKLLEEEARIAWKNQLQAWEAGQRWRNEPGRATKPSDPDDADPLWTELQDAQQRAFQAARQIRVHLQTLTDKFERNHMGQDFMAGRLSVVAELLVRLQEQEHAPIATSLQDARPQSAADVVPERLTKLRATALEQSHNHQKMAVLILERMLRKLYDWRDLQSAAITTKLLHEQQEEVLQRTEQVAPKTIAKEIEDLSDQDQDRLLTLGKQQRAIFDSETGLEQQLTYMMYKAEKQVRKSILDPLRAAFTNLRNNRVNDHLKHSAELIANNQPSQIINSQKAALRALKVVQAGLVAAGQKVDDEEPLALTMTPTSAAQFDPDQIKPLEVAAKTPENTGDAASVETPSAIELPTLPEGSDALSAAIRLAIELEDSVLARMRYLDQNRTAAEMPRFVQLKLPRLRERQQDALAALSRADQLNGDKLASPGGPEPTAATPSPHVAAMLTLVRTEFQHAHELVKAAEIDAHSQQLQADAIATLQGVLQNIAFRKAIDDATAENRRLNGVDGFSRPYLLHDKDLEVAIDVVGQLHYVRQRQAHAQRLIARFVLHPAIGPKGRELAAQSRQQAAESQRAVAEGLAQVIQRGETVSTEVAERMRSAGLGGLASLRPANWVSQIEAGKTDAQLEPRQRDAVQQIDATLLSLRDLLEERIRPAPTGVAKSDESLKMTLEDYQRLTSPEQLAELLKTETSLPPELREVMVRSLQRDLPPKYRELLTAYFASFDQPQTKPEKEANK